MGYRYDMQNKSAQAQAIVRKIDKQEEIREEQRKKNKQDKLEKQEK